MKKPPYFGQCLCGAIKYQVDDLLPRMGHCHCTMCRKFHGAAFATFGEARLEDFHWLTGKACLQSYIADNLTTRQFCKQCGSSMTFKPANDEGKFIEFSLATLDTPIQEKPDAHIFTDFKANWYNIIDALPQFLSGRYSLKREK